MNQRWRERKAIFRRPGEQIRTSEYDVAELLEDATAKRFVEQHHYSGTYPAARFRFGLFHRGDLAGVAVFSHPTNDRTLTNVFGGSAMDSVELGRFILLDEVPGNGETWFLGHCLRSLRRRRLAGVVSFCDPLPRDTADGDQVFPGHIGTIYQAGNACYLGRGTARSLRLLPDGTAFSARAIQKIRRLECGWRYAAQRLVEFGADAPAGRPRDWLAKWLPRLTRLMRHPGNHKYAWSFGKVYLASGIYPKKEAA